MISKKGAVLVLLMLGSPVFLADLQPSMAVAFSLVNQFISELTSKDEQRFIKEVFPEADVFSPKEGDPPYYKAYKTDPQTNSRTLVGLVFFTADVEPRERGYEGPINIAVAMTLQGVIARVKTVEHREPYGYFSVDLPRFTDQFTGKSIRDRFRYGRDIDAVARATMSIGSASRSIRKGARRILKQHLEKEG